MKFCNYNLYLFFKKNKIMDTFYKKIFNLKKPFVKQVKKSNKKYLESLEKQCLTSYWKKCLPKTVKKNRSGQLV